MKGWHCLSFNLLEYSKLHDRKRACLKLNWSYRPKEARSGADSNDWKEQRFPWRRLSQGALLLSCRNGTRCFMGNSGAGDTPHWDMGLSGAVTAVAGLWSRKRPRGPTGTSVLDKALPLTEDIARTWHEGSYSLLTALQLNARYVQSLIFQNIHIISCRNKY